MRRNRASLTLVIALAVTLVPFATAAAVTLPTAPRAAGDIEWSVEPVQTSDGARRAFEYSVDPGTQIIDSVVITNVGDTSAEFLVYATDAINVPETGAFGLLERDDAPTDVGSWITTDTDAITIDPGMQATVPFNLLIPSDATPGEHVAGIIASVVTDGESEGAAVELEQRVAARVYLTVSGAIESGLEIEGISSGFNPELNPFAPGELDLSYTVRNSGNVRVDVVQNVVVTGPFGIQLATFTPEPFRELLPRQTVRVETTIPAIIALLAVSTSVEVTPGPVGSTDAASEETPADEAPVVAEEADPAAPVVDEEVIVDDLAVEYTPVSESTWTFAVSPSMLALVVLIIVLGYLVWRYVTGTRERLYLAIDEATAAAREESEKANREKDSVDA